MRLGVLMIFYSLPNGFTFDFVYIVYLLAWFWLGVKLCLACQGIKHLEAGPRERSKLSQRFARDFHLEMQPRGAWLLMTVSTPWAFFSHFSSRHLALCPLFCFMSPIALAPFVSRLPLLFVSELG